MTCLIIYSLYKNRKLSILNSLSHEPGTGPYHEKARPPCFRPGSTQTSLPATVLIFRMYKIFRYRTILSQGTTKALNSLQHICPFVVGMLEKVGSLVMGFNVNMVVELIFELSIILVQSISTCLVGS